MIKESLVFWAFGLAFSVLLYYFLMKSNKILVQKRNTNAERWAAQSKPLFGGVGFIVLFIFAALYWLTLVPHSNEYKNQNFVICIVVIISFAMGLIDDIRHSSPYFKLAIQAISAILLIQVNVYIHLFSINWINYAITIFWVVGIMNSINMLDNMDAITATNSTVIISTLTVIQWLTGQTETFLFIASVGTLASLLAFLLWNWHPAKMYMGDNGSQFLGAMLAILGIKFAWNINPQTLGQNNFVSFISVLLLFIVPLTDTTTVTINRISKGKSPFVGGRDHTTHHLSYCGLKDNYIAILLVSISIVSSITFLYLNFVISKISTLHAIALSSAIFVIFSALYSTTIFGKRKV